MKRFAVLRLVLASVLFAGWIGWLVYLAATKSRPIVLSRPQLLVSDLDVIAQVDNPAKKVIVKEVYAWRDKEAPPAVNDTLDVVDLDKCHRVPHDGEADDDVPRDWQGPGLYILPLRKVGGHYEVVPIPPSPGFPFFRGPRRIYPLTNETHADLKAIKEPGAAAP